MAAIINLEKDTRPVHIDYQSWWQNRLEDAYQTGAIGALDAVYTLSVASPEYEQQESYVRHFLRGYYGGLKEAMRLG